MGKEGFNGMGSVTALSDFKDRKVAMERHPASGLARRLSDKLREKQRPTVFRNAIIDKQIKHLQQTETTDAKILPFPTNPDPTEPIA